MRDWSDSGQNILRFAPGEGIPRFYQFGHFRFDARERLLFRDDQPAPLTPKVAQLLLIFLRSRRDLLTKEALMSALWPDLFVEESNLKQNVFVLRKALGNGFESEDFIVTIPRRGYRFVAEVAELGAPDEIPRPGVPGTDRTARADHRRYIAIAVLAIIATAATYVLTTRLVKGNPEGRPDGISQPAYQCFLKGRYHSSRYTVADSQKAVEHFRTAVERDPKFALAWAGLADTYNFLGDVPRARVAAERALEIDRNLAEAHASLANASLFHDFDWPAAEQHIQRAIELNPSYATAHHWYALLLSARGRQDEASREVERARTLDPVSLSINTGVGQVLFYARRYDEAIRKYRQVLRVDPHFAPGRFALAEALLRAGNAGASAAELPNPPPAGELLGEIHAALGETARAGEIATRLEKQFHEDSAHASAYHIARLRVALGDPSRAMEWLEKSFRDRDRDLAMINVDPGFDSLRTDLRFRQFLRRTALAIE